MDNEHSPKTFSEVLTDELNDIPQDVPVRRQAFDACRICQGLAQLNSVNFTFDDAMPYMERYCDYWEIDRDEFIEAAFLAWPTIKHPAGVSIVAEAYKEVKSKGCKYLKGKWPTQRLRKDVAVTYAIARQLSENCTHDFYLSCRDLADVLDCDKNRAGSILNMLVAHGYLEKIGNAGMHWAQVFRCKTHTQYSSTQDTEPKYSEPSTHVLGIQERMSPSGDGGRSFNVAEFASNFKGIGDE